MIRHLSNKKFKGWEEITQAWGVFFGSNKFSQIKQTKRFMRKIMIPVLTDQDEIIYIKPVQKIGKYVFSDQDTLCTLKCDYLFGRKDIARYINKSTIQFSRYLKKYPSLKKIIYNPTGKFFYINKYDLDDWLSIQKWKYLKSSGKMEVYYKERERCFRRWKENKYAFGNKFNVELGKIQIKYWGRSFPKADPENENDRYTCLICGEELKI